MTSSDSPYLYVLLGNASVVVEYDYRVSQRAIRFFGLPREEGRSRKAAVTWVPAPNSKHKGFFYVGSQFSGTVFIYEIPLTADTGASPVPGGKYYSRLLRSWEPKPDT